MKRKDKETLLLLSDAEMRAQAADLKKRIFQLKFKRAVAPIENPLALRTARRKIAMINTWLTQRGLAKAKAGAGAVSAHGQQTVKTAAEVKK